MGHPLDDARLTAESALQLPLDSGRAPSTGVALEECSFEVRVAPLGDAMWAAAFAIQLHRYNGPAVIPLSASRRTTAGQVLWTAPWRLHVDGTRSRDLVRDVEDLLQKGAPGHAAGAPARDTSGNHAAITWLEPAASRDEHATLDVLRRSARDARPADLHLVIAGDRQRATFVYDAKLFKRATIERFAGHLGVLLEGIAARPDERVARLPLLAPAERRWLDEMSRGRSHPRATEPVHRLFERRAAATPDAVAVRFRDLRLTYRELNARANRLAHLLAARGAGAESKIVVCVEPSLDIAVALLGILKAGAVYVPLDPTYPEPRIRAILDDTRPAWVVSNGYLIERLGLAAFPTIALDAKGDPLAGSSDADLATAVAPSQSAYVYYTSGTTGKPKGVMATQANLTSYVLMAHERYQFDARDVMPAIARFSFSISMFELMSPLVAGGTLIVLDRDHVLDTARMARTLTEVTFFHAGPSLLKNLLPHIERSYPDFAPFAGVRHASSGGDMIAPEILETLKRIFTQAEVFVIYGCSEIACMGCTYPVPRDRTITKTYVGRPFDNTTVRLFDASFNQVPVGVVGEIHFSGGGVVPGYLNRADVTAEKFVTIDGERFYRTGDLGRMSEDGWIEILGRNDFQIKLRGMRIELAEVEHHLRRAPGVRDAVAMARDGANGEKILVAYIVFDRPGSDADRRAALSGIRRYISENLPDYMIPASYVELEGLPLNHNMKVDRFALPEPPRSDRRTAHDPRVRAPETDTEKQLAAHWRRALGVEHVGLDDHFFELGGHSILATDFIAAFEREAGVALDGMDVLRESLEVLAGIVDQRLGRAARKTTARAPDRVEPIDVFHFGRDEELYGVLHGAPRANGGAPAREAVLVCAPVGQERVRAHFILNRLARTLAARGVPVLQFDYFGTWDSMGDSVEATCSRWQEDIAAAHAELVRRTGAARIVCVGVRLGATLLCNAGEKLDVSRLVLWDPVGDGASHYADMVRMQQRYLRGMQHLRLGRRLERLLGAEELLGTTYSDAALRELRQLAIAKSIASGRTPLRWLVTSHHARQRALFHAASAGRDGCKLETLDVDSYWHDVARLDDILPDVGISRALAAMIGDDA